MKRTFFRFLAAGSILLYMLGISNTPAYSQPVLDLKIDSVTDTDFPTVDVYVSVSDAQGYPIEGLLANNFSLLEEGQPVSALEASPVNQGTLKIILLIDTSESIKYGGPPNPLEAIVQTAKGFVSQLADQDRVAVITFSSEVEIVQGLTIDKQLVIEALDRLEPQETYGKLNDALAQAVNVLKNETGRRTIILFTDSPDAGSTDFTFDQALDEAVRQKVIVYPIGWRYANKNDLKVLAELTAGEPQYLVDSYPGTTSFETAMGVIKQYVDTLREQYLLRFTSALPADDLEHQFIVRVNYLGTQTEQAGTFVAKSLGLSVQITEPADGSTVSDSVRIAASANARAGISKVDFLVDGVFLQSEDTAPYEFQWDLSKIPAGNHQIQVTAYDNNNFSESSTITVNVEIHGMLGWIVAIVALAFAAILIPIGLHNRKRKMGASPAKVRGAPSRGMQPVLRELEGLNPDQVWPLATGEIRLGRKSDENEVPLKGLKASRRHAVIRFEQGQYVIYGLSPNNPVVVNNAPVSQYVLKAGDVIRLGETTLRYEQG